MYYYQKPTDISCTNADMKKRHSRFLSLQSVIIGGEKIWIHPRLVQQRRQIVLIWQATHKKKQEPHRGSHPKVASEMPSFTG
jgi:hypothetical protein